MPRNQFQRMVFAFLTVLVTVHGYVFYSLYGSGDGQWLRDWDERMMGSGATVLNGEGLICHETPDEGNISECESLGKQLAAV